MRFIKFLLTYLGIYVSLVACSNGIKEADFPFQEKNSEIFTDLFQLVKKSSITIPLDDSIGLYNRSVQYVNLNNRNYLSILNILSSSVYFYDYDNRKIAYKVHLAKEGPDGVGKLDALSAHFVISVDSVAIINYKQQMMYIVDRKGSVFKKYSLQHGTEPYANPSSIHKIVKVGNQFYIPCHVNGIYDSNSQSTSIIKLDLLTGIREHNFMLPNLYNKGAWLSPGKYVPVLVNNPSNGHLIITFPIDPFLYEVDPNGKVNAQHYVGSKFFRRSLPYSVENSESFVKNISSEKVNDYILSSPSYNNFLPINGGEYFLREVILTPSLEEVRGISKPKLQNSFIILDKNFEKVGETLLPKEVYSTNVSFINNIGLHIANYSLYGKNENQLTFDIFKIETK